MTSVEEIVAQEMSQMSLTEREQAYEELHGVVRVAEETPAFVAQCMQELDQAVRAISKKDAYDLAERLNFQYVHDPKFRLMFLRADYFDAEKAAARLVKFMEEKLKYFGPQALARPLFLSDLDDEDTKTLESGKLQILPSRDRSGRTVMCDCLTMFPKCYKNVVNLVSTLFDGKSISSLLSQNRSSYFLALAEVVYIYRIMCCRRRRNANTWFGGTLLPHGHHWTQPTPRIV